MRVYSRQLYYQMNSFRGIFRHHFMLPLCFDLSPPPQILRSPPLTRLPIPSGGGRIPPVFATPVETVMHTLTLRWVPVKCKSTKKWLQTFMNPGMPFVVLLYLFLYGVESFIQVFVYAHATRVILPRWLFSNNARSDHINNLQ